MWKGCPNVPASPAPLVPYEHPALFATVVELVENACHAETLASRACWAWELLTECVLRRAGVGPAESISAPIRGAGVVASEGFEQQRPQVRDIVLESTANLTHVAHSRSSATVSIVRSGSEKIWTEQAPSKLDSDAHARDPASLSNSEPVDLPKRSGTREGAVKCSDRARP